MQKVTKTRIPSKIKEEQLQKIDEENKKTEDVPVSIHLECSKASRRRSNTDFADTTTGKKTKRSSTHSKKKTKRSTMDRKFIESNMLEKLPTEIKNPPNGTEDEKNKLAEKARNDLLSAILQKDTQSVPFLIDNVKKYGNLNYKAGKNHFSLLHRCVVQQGSTEIIKILLESNAKVDITDLHLRSALHLAAEIGTIESMKLLLHYKANAMQKDYENCVPLHKAAKFGHRDCVETLLDHNALINHRNIDGNSALHLAVRFDNADCVESLLNRGADVLLLNQLNERPYDLLNKIEIQNGASLSAHGKLKLTKSAKTIKKMLKKRGGNKTVLLNQQKIEIKGIGHHPTKREGTIAKFTHLSSTLSSARSNQVIKVQPPIAKGASKVNMESRFEDFIEEKSDLSEEEKNQNHTPKKDAPTEKFDKFGFVIRAGKANGTHPVVQASKRINEDAIALKWITYLQNWDQKFSKKKSKILKMCDMGIPGSVRGQVWRSLCNLKVDNDLYNDLLEKKNWNEEIYEQILRDINRTMPGHILFKEHGRGQKMLTNVLLAYSSYRPEVGYCQGMGFITAMFLMYMTEEESFFMLEKIASEYGFDKIWNFKHIKHCIITLNQIIIEHYPRCIRAFEKQGIPIDSFASQFFITGYLYNLPFEMAVRVWDSFWLRKFDFWYAIAIAIFKISQDEIPKLGMEKLMSFFQFKETGYIPFEIDQLLEVAIRKFSTLKTSYLRKKEEIANVQIEEERVALEKRRAEVAIKAKEREEKYQVMLKEQEEQEQKLREKEATE